MFDQAPPPNLPSLEPPSGGLPPRPETPPPPPTLESLRPTIPSAPAPLLRPSLPPEPEDIFSGVDAVSPTPTRPTMTPPPLTPPSPPTPRVPDIPSHYLQESHGFPWRGIIIGLLVVVILGGVGYGVYALRGQLFSQSSTTTTSLPTYTPPDQGTFGSPPNTDTNIPAANTPVNTPAVNSPDTNAPAVNTPTTGSVAPQDDPNSKVDSDGDGLTDYQEVHIYHTDPHNPDTDGDGLYDGEEVNTFHTDPVMALFGKSKKKPDAPPAAGTPPPTTINPSTVIFTMPQKFLVPDKPPFWNATKIWIVVGVVVIALVGGVFWVVIGLKPAATPAQPSTNVAAANTPTSTPDNTLPTLPDTNIPTNAPDANAPVVNAPDNQPTVTPVNEPVNTPVTTPPPSTTATVLPTGKDSDKDGLTDAEEQVLGTDPQNPDTDHDGFPDLSEIQKGYNPKGQGSLRDSGLFNTYTNGKHSYHIMYPSAWSAQVSNGNEDEVDFTAAPGEFISVTLETNPSGQSILDWYKALPGAEGVSTATTTSVGSWTGVFSPDKRTFYTIASARPNDVFVITDNVGTKTEIDYPFIYNFMIASLVATS